MNRLIVFFLVIVLALSAVGCSQPEQLQTQQDDIRMSFDEADELYYRRSLLFESTASYIMKDAGGFSRKNADNDVFLKIDMQESQSEMRRLLSEYGFEGKTIDDFITLIYDEQIGHIVWNSDDTVDYYMYDGYSVICCSEFAPQKSGQLQNAHVSQLDKNWFYLEAVRRLVV